MRNPSLDVVRSQLAAFSALPNIIPASPQSVVLPRTSCLSSSLCCLLLQPNDLYSRVRITPRQLEQRCSRGERHLTSDRFLSAFSPISFN